MEHVAIDLGGRESQVCIRNAEAEIVLQRRVRTRELGAFLATRPASRVVLETCAEAFSVASAAREIGHEVKVVPATAVRSLGVGSRRTKTDRRDAQILSEVSCKIDLASVHVPSVESRTLRAMCTARDALVGSRTKLANSVRGWLRSHVTLLKKGAPGTLPARVRAWCTANGTPCPSFIERQLLAIEALTLEIESATDELVEIAEKNPVAIRLMTIPGVGPLTSIRFIAAVDDISRFDNAHRLEAYLGVTPGEHSSSDSRRITSITKAGSAKVRWLLVQSAWAAIRTRPQDPMCIWATRIAERRGKGVAVIALARKLAGIMFAMWRDGTEYAPTRSAAT
jgi:transposase